MTILKFKCIIALMTCMTYSVSAAEIAVKISKKYLNIPVSGKEKRSIMRFEVDHRVEREFVVRLATDKPDYWVFCDVTALKGKTIKISYEGDNAGIRNIYQDDVIQGNDSLYKETNRPQFHFTTRRGWINDPNGLIYYDNEYHLFYQHNPYEREWENMHWGHAVSKDLLHWEELPLALYPDKQGTAFSGSAVIDYDNTAGFNKNELPAMFAIYTADSPEKQVQCLAYSLNKGRTWTKYEGNPVIDSKAKWNSKDTRDPKVFWYKPGKHWVLVLNERDGHSIYTSSDLKKWNYESHTSGFWECPDLFELPVDGSPDQTRWVMYGASGTYMLGDFDGKEFTPTSGKHCFITGSNYAAQTYANIPSSDGRRIQIAWGRIPQKEMPFNMMMLLPTELSLRTTKDGIRLFNVPIREVEKLQDIPVKWQSLKSKEANELMKQFYQSDYLRIKTTLKLSHATDAGFNLFGQRLIGYNMNFNLLNDVFYSPQDMTSMEISADIFIDKTSVEVFIDGGAYSYSMERKAVEGNTEGFHFWGNNIEIKNLEIAKINSVWK